MVDKIHNFVDYCFEQEGFKGRLLKVLACICVTLTYITFIISILIGFMIACFLLIIDLIFLLPNCLIWLFFGKVWFFKLFDYYKDNIMGKFYFLNIQIE